MHRCAFKAFASTAGELAGAHLSDLVQNHQELLCMFAANS